MLVGCIAGLRMSISGRAISANGSTAMSVQNAVGAAWRPFWASGQIAARGLSELARKVLLESWVWPTMAYRAPRWRLDARTCRYLDASLR